jgi:hypothetical protein
MWITHFFEKRALPLIRVISGDNGKWVLPQMFNGKIRIVKNIKKWVAMAVTISLAISGNSGNGIIYTVALPRIANGV